jgi:glycosyltransferase involved in cell wall biosynthesis
VSVESGGIWWVHPAIQPYREELFRLLDRELDMRFVFVGWRDHNLRAVPKVGLRRWVAMQDRGLGPYREGVSLKLTRTALTGSYDVWISSALNWWPTHTAFPLVKARRKPFVLWTVDWWWPDTPGAGVARAYDRVMLRNADALIVGGSKTRRFAIENGAPPERIFVAPETMLALDEREWSEEEVRETRRALVGDDSTFVFLFLNRIVAYKGLDVLLRAFRSVESKEPNARLLVCGNGPERPRCESLVAELGLKNVRFVGAVDHDRVHLVYRASDLYVHPARFLSGVRVKAEAWGFTVNEAMSVGTPVLATTAVAAGEDLIDDEVDGFVVPAGDVDALSNRMLFAINNAEVLEGMGKKAQRKMRESFTPRHQFDGFRKALDYLRERRG